MRAEPRLDDCLGRHKGLAGVQEPQQPLDDALHILHLHAARPLRITSLRALQSGAPHQTSMLCTEKPQ